jgi:hypothetical protein
MQKSVILALALAFVAGWLSSTGVSFSTTPVLEQAEERVSVFAQAEDLPSPTDTLTLRDVHVLPNRVEIDVVGGIPAVFQDTNSMDPVLDSESIAIEQTITDPSEVQIGDIVSYEVPFQPGTFIVHRVVDIQTDEDGLYFVMKGDNLKTTDPFKVRPDQLRR